MVSKLPARGARSSRHRDWRAAYENDVTDAVLFQLQIEVGVRETRSSPGAL
jgi:hypothetical protein